MNYLKCILIVLLLYRLLPIYQEHSRCVYEYSLNNQRWVVRKEDLTFMKLIKHIPPRTTGRHQNIPFIIHQTNENDTLPSDMVMAIESVVENNPQYEYRFYNGTQRREFMRNSMGVTVLSCYDKIVPNAYKADLFRYSVVYTHGGCYADIGFIFIGSLSSVIQESDSFVSTPDAVFPRVGVNSAFFCASKHHPILALAIENIVRRVTNNDYGTDDIDVTGPKLFIKAFKEYFNNPEMRVAQGVYPRNVRLLQRYNIEPPCIVSQLNTLDGAPLIHQKYPRYLEDMSVASSVGHYSEYYRNHSVYNESVMVKDGLSFHLRKKSEEGD